MNVLHTEPKEFFVWVDPHNWLVRHSIGIIGSIVQPPPSPEACGADNLLFIHNSNHKQGAVSPFHLNTIRKYLVEYDLERFRHANFAHLPSRLHALYLFADRQNASAYHAAYQGHVGQRVLKRGVTEGPYHYSIHDSGWIDFLNLGHSIDVDTFNVCWRGYWTGQSINTIKFQSFGQPWKGASIMEVLFYGRTRFPNKDVTVFD